MTDSRAPGAVIVSGGSRGLGRALVDSLRAGGSAVATFSRGEPAGMEVWRDDPGVLWQQLDATDYDALSVFVKSVERRFGRVAGLVNNAAVGVDGLLTTMSVADIDRAVDTNIRGPILLTKLVAGRMLKHRAGSIVTISSINALRGHRGLAVYSASKAALDGMTRSLARELGECGIRVNTVAPGYFDSEMVRGLGTDAVARIVRRTPLGRLCTDADIVEVVRFLLREDTFVTGQTIAVDGGFTC
jgi:3-oxoacyl-[acyl-carrier protein] reductase